MMSLVNPSLTYLASFGAASAIQLLSMPLINRLDFSMLHAKKQAQSYGSGNTDAPDDGPKLTELLKTCMSPKMLFVVVVTFLCGWESALIDVFFNVHLSNIGAPVSKRPKEKPLGEVPMMTQTFPPSTLAPCIPAVLFVSPPQLR